MDILKRFRSVSYEDIEKEIANGIKTGTIRQFDEDFYSQFDNKYFGGLPVYHYLKKMNLKKCYDTAAILALAMDCDCKFCFGELKNLSRASHSWFGHGWVEKDNLVYDTTWQIILDKKLYDNIFCIKDATIGMASDYFEKTKFYTEWKIHDKKFYEEENGLSSSWALVSLVKQLELFRLEKPNTTNEERAYSKKLLNDLPEVKSHNINDIPEFLI